MILLLAWLSLSRSLVLPRAAQRAVVGGRFAAADTTETYSFLRDEMRPASMRLHTREQAPREGKAKSPDSQPPMKAWNPTLSQFLGFLSDSRAVCSRRAAIENPWGSVWQFEQHLPEPCGWIRCCRPPDNNAPLPRR